ncbi:hypothetical protein OS122_02795 [Mycolicibacterium mucogenicum]|uniref:hypothetical protein n=1 Tax=Mycolicibacterium mucogenicum TaxID=56689 RepID=UPI00226A9ACB|nr:hypothetical protein [Mycolicibacterium mucogenicum]MCX8559827.1 hypothetical protein [Mycolicibacterium mucogenicum]
MVTFHGLSPADDGEDGRLSPIDFSEFFRASVDDLANAPESNPPDASIAERIDAARLGELEDARKYRRRIVRFTLITVGFLVLAATGFMVTYFVSQWDQVESSVMIAFFSSIVVESIGILYIISRYLFPNSGPEKKDGAEK